MNKKINKLLSLGTTTDGDLTLTIKTLQRHFACFGSSGSGKTVASKVLMEELARQGIPIIAFDPQGDIASLALIESNEELEKRGVESSIQKDFEENVEVVIWTPGSSKGLPICINPLQFDGIDELSYEDKTRTFSSIAKNISSLVGYDLDNDDGKSAEAVLAVLFEHCYNENITLFDFNDVVEILGDLPKTITTVVTSVGTSQFLKGLMKKLSLLTLGSRKLIFQTGVPANIDALLGKDGSTDKTRISVIYLNTLHSTEEKEFFISGISQLLYRWMLKNPLKGGQEGVQCAMFIDEIAPYIPPVKVPSCKQNLELLFRQGRKYGVSSLIATQSPGDIDYKAIGQFSTFILGTLNTKQDIDKVKKRLESVAPKEIDYIVTQLPALKPGHFLLVSPDEYDRVQKLSVRWLVTQHKVITEHQLSALISDEHRSFYVQESLEDDSKLETQEVDSDPMQESEQIEEQSPKKSLDSANEDTILAVQNKIFERDLERKVKRYLSGTVLKSEKLYKVSFKYLPLIKTSLLFLDQKGFFNKTITEIPENLYLDFKTHDIMFIKNDVINFASVVDIDPHKIMDLDDCCTIELLNKSQVDFDFRSLGGRKLNKKKVKHNLERKYKVKVKDSELIIFPLWECTIKNKKDGKTRIIMIDGIFGNQMSIKP